MTHPINTPIDGFVIRTISAFIEPTAAPRTIIERIAARQLINTASLLNATLSAGEPSDFSVPVQIAQGDDMLACQAIITDVLGAMYQAVVLCEIKGLHGRNFCEEETEQSVYYVLIEPTAVDQVRVSDIMRLSKPLDNLKELWSEALDYLTPYE